MGTFSIEGGHPLSGSITPQGAKNEALQILSAVLLTPEPMVIHNIPNIIDVNKLIQLIADFGVQVDQIGPNSYRFEARDVQVDYMQSDAFKKDVEDCAARL